ncbi:helix-turn-helix domain-containing protein [Kitasatospora aureofaciens]|uniref:helix-turn-helix domain-containing protein n=1 Tax=Kitasatospora aureofaciens TaxID=1894 RepID=UPI0036F4A01F
MISLSRNRSPSLSGTVLEPEHQARQRKDLAEALRDLRKASGLSGERLARRCSMSQSKISRIETGKILPTVLDVELILSAFDGIPQQVERELLELARTANVDYTAWRAYARLGLYHKQAELPDILQHTQDAIRAAGFNIDQDLWRAPDDDSLVTVTAGCQHVPAKDGPIKPMPKPQHPCHKPKTA